MVENWFERRLFYQNLDWEYTGRIYWVVVQLGSLEFQYNDGGLN